MLQVLEGLAYVGFIAGAIFAVMELREIGKSRSVSIVADMYATFISADMTKAYSKIITGNYQNAADMEQECSHSSLVGVAGFFEGVGYLSRHRLVDPKVVMDFLPVTPVWRKMQDWVMYDRERTDPNQWTEFEYLGIATEAYDAEYTVKMKAELDALKVRIKERGA